MRGQKIRAAKEREKVKKQRLLEEARLLANAERLKNLEGGFTLVLHGVKFVPKAKHREVLKIEAKREVSEYKAGNHPPPVTVVKSRERLSEEMQAREDRAQREIKEKKKLSMPLYNKGPTQYPTTADLEAMKNGELRRRS